MHLTEQQTATLKAAIFADAEMVAWIASNQLPLIARKLNLPASPAYTVWRTSVDSTEYRDAIVWTELTGRSAGERDMFSFLTGGGTLPLNMARANVRQGMQDAFSGAAGQVTRQALLELGKRPASTFERLFATGTGSNGSPGVMVLEGPIDADEVAMAIR